MKLKDFLESNISMLTSCLNKLDKFIYVILIANTQKSEFSSNSKVQINSALAFTYMLLYYY